MHKSIENTTKLQGKELAAYQSGQVVGRTLVVLF